MRKALVQRVVVDAPAPSKKSRRTEDDSGFIRKHIKRLFRKMKRRIGDDCRDLPSTFDAQAWHRQQQSRAAPGSNHDHQSIRQRYHSPTRDGPAKPMAWTKPNHPAAPR
jgi:hypothetical protein